MAVSFHLLLDQTIHNLTWGVGIKVQRIGKGEDKDMSFGIYFHYFHKHFAEFKFHFAIFKLF